MTHTPPPIARADTLMKPFCIAYNTVHTYCTYRPDGSSDSKSQVHPSDLDLARDADLHDVHPTLQLGLGRHAAAPHQLRALSHVRILHHARNSKDRFALCIVRDPARRVAVRIVLLRALEYHIIVPVDRRVPAVPQLRADGGPEDRREGLWRRRRIQDLRRGVAAVVLRYVPVLDTDRRSVPAGSVVRVCCDVTDGENVRLAYDLVSFVHAHRAVLFEFDLGARREVVGRGLYACAFDHEVAFEDGAVFEVHGADFGGVRGRGRGFDDAGAEVEFGAVLLDYALDDGADFCAEDFLHGTGLHADDRHLVFLGREAVAGFHADEGRADDDDLLASFVAGCLHDGLCVCERAEDKDVAQIALETVDGQHLGRATGRHDELRVSVRLAVFGRDFLCLEIDVCDIGVNKVDAALFVKVGRAPLDLCGIGDEGLGKLCAVEGLGVLASDNGYLALVTSTAKTLDGAKSSTTTGNELV